MTGISINDLRKNLRDLNEYMDHECRSAPARYGVILDASLITGIDPPPEVESALAAINTAHNQVSSDISLAQAAADQRVVQSRRAVEIETLRAQAEVEPVKSLAAELAALHRAGPDMLGAYLRNVRLALYDKAQQIYLEAGEMSTDLPIVGLLSAALVAFVGAFIAEPILLGLCRIFGLYAIVQERTCRVYVLFGKVIGVSTSRACTSCPANSGRRRSSSTSWAPATCSTCGSTRSTCAASRSTPRKARPWASASGTRCGSAIRSRISSRTPTRAARCAPTSATPRCAA